jgi:hypothetical protein
MEIKRVEMLAAVEVLHGSRYRCVCDCGTERIVSVGHFNTGAVKSAHTRNPQPERTDAVIVEIPPDEAPQLAEVH